MRTVSLALLAIVLNGCASSGTDQVAANDDEERVYVTGSSIPRKKSQVPSEVKTVSGEAAGKAISASAGIGGVGPSGK